MSVLRFRSLSVRRMPGIRDSGFELDSLAPGVNVVFGPNASGKTTTARALETLLWPARAPDGSVWVSGTFDLAGDRWSAELDAGRARLQRNGEPTGAPHGLPVEASSRYRLELRDLLEAEDRGLARAIGLESAGGYDLAAAAAVLSPRRTASRPNSAVAEVRQARERLATAKAVQDELQLETATIQSDQQRIEAIPEREQRIEQLRVAFDHASRLRDAEEARARLGAFQPAVARLAGDEDSRVAELQRKIAESREGERAAADAMARAEESLRRLSFPGDLDPAETLAALDAHVAEIDRIDAELRSERRALEEATVQLRREGERLGSLDAEDLSQADLRAITELVEIARDVGTVRVRRAALEEEMGLLSMEPDVGNRVDLEQGIRILQQWLATAPQASDYAHRRIAIVASVALLIVGTALAILYPVALLISAAGVILLSLTLRGPNVPDDRPGLQLRYRDSGLSGPNGWTTESVRTLLASLQDHSITARLREDAERRAQRLTAQADEAREQEATLRTTFAESAETAGLANVDAGAVGWLLERVSRWQSAAAEVEGATARLETASRHRADELRAAGELLQALGLSGPSDSSGVRAAAQTLGNRVRSLARVSSELEARSRERDAAKSRGTELLGEMSGLLERLELGEEDIPQLGEWCRQRPEYLVARREADTLEGEVGRLRNRLEGLVEGDLSLLSADPASIEHEIREQTEVLSELKELQLRVMELRTRVTQATRGHDIEDALAEVDRAETALRRIRDRDARSALASVLVDHVEAAARNDQRPEVFHRASDLFTRVTRGRYQLLLDDRIEPGFRALDTQQDRSLGLDELSSATRLQLLLAVRVGFVEMQEGGVQLPILMDETLANSDDDRATAIIEAVIALAAAGRQVFYFTAQRDEVAKWRAALESEPSVESSFIDLAAIRKQERRLEEEALTAATEPLPELPAPDGHSHAAYGLVLEVPAVNIAEPVGALHLWYLVEDPDDLYRVMTATRAERWGSLRALLETGMGGLIPNSLARKVEALAGAAHATLLRLRVGRNRPVDRNALAQSGAVSERFIEEVWEVADGASGDGVLLLEALEHRVVAKFLQKNIQALREFLEESGYIDARPPLSATTIRWEALSESSRAIEDGIVTTEEVERLLVRLGVAPAWNQPVPETEIHPRRLQTAFEFE